MIMETVKEAKLTRFITAESIDDAVRSIAAKIDEDYNDRNPILIGVLNGAFVFLADLMRYLKIECEVDFLKLSSYGNEKISSGDVTILKELNCNPTGRDVIIVEDIVDTGASIEFIKRLLEKEQPASIRFATLLYKSSKCNLEFAIDYKGFEIEDKYCVGYGMDWAQKYRNLKDIYVL